MPLPASPLLAPLTELPGTVGMTAKALTKPCPLAWDRAGDGRKRARAPRGLQPQGGAGAQPPYHRGRGGGAGLATGRRSLLGGAPDNTGFSLNLPRRWKWQRQSSSFLGHKPRIHPWPLF